MYVIEILMLIFLSDIVYSHAVKYKRTLVIFCVSPSSPCYPPFVIIAAYSCYYC